MLASAALAAILAAGAAYAQPPSTTDEAPAHDTTASQGDVAVEPTVTAPASTTAVTVDKTVVDTEGNTVETTTEVIAQVSDRPDLNPTNPIAPEVQAVVDAKANYTTADLANAQLAAVLATPPSTPTTIITTTRTTPKEGG